jgi:hypothetical protein
MKYLLRKRLWIRSIKHLLNNYYSKLNMQLFLIVPVTKDSISTLFDTTLHCISIRALRSNQVLDAVVGKDLFSAPLFRPIIEARNLFVIHN